MLISMFHDEKKVQLNRKKNNYIRSQDHCEAEITNHHQNSFAFYSPNLLDIDEVVQMLETQSSCYFGHIVAGMILRVEDCVFGRTLRLGSTNNQEDHRNWNHIEMCRRIQTCVII